VVRDNQQQGKGKEVGQLKGEGAKLSKWDLFNGLAFKWGRLAQWFESYSRATQYFILF
jgi:hypothetical protein